MESQPLDLQGSPWPDWWLVSGLPQCSARQAGFIKSKHVRRARERKRQRASENGSPQPSVTSVALRHVTRATSCHFSCALSIRSTSLGPAHIQRERVTQELDCQGAGGTGSRFRRLPTPGGADGKGPACPCRRHKRRGFNPCSRRSPGGGHGKPLQCSSLENPSIEEPGRLHSMGSQRVRQD